MILTTKIKKIVYTYSLILILFSCHKKQIINNVVDKTSDCPEMYDARSTPYINPYMGTLATGSMIPPNLRYSEKYSYSQPCVNPNNEFEICYLRRDNAIQEEDDLDLFKYNFCSGKTTFLTNHVCLLPDWSIKGWIIFSGQDRQIWKIKSNGDSLIGLKIGGFRAKWDPMGSKFLLDGKQILDENGVIIKSLTIPGSTNTWLDDSTIIFNAMGNPSDDFELERLNVNTGFREIIFSEAKNGTSYIYKYNKKSKTVYFAISSGYLINYGSINIETKEKKLLGAFEQSFVLVNLTAVEKNKVILQQILKDTMTGSPVLLNYRSHIAIMNLDGSDEREVKIPE